MKNIKFRAWSEDTCEMVQVARLDIKEETIYYENGIKSLNREQELGFWWKPYILMQYTGLKDKNGVHIFEGDILKLDIWQGQEDNYVDSVTHDVVTGRPSKYIKKLGELKKDTFGGLYVNDFYLLNLEIADNYEIEVIGNIYQNKGLLEEEE